jgi:hypothetical protein
VLVDYRYVKLSLQKGSICYFGTGLLCAKPVEYYMLLHNISCGANDVKQIIQLSLSDAQIYSDQ